jgi:hypothetical protein
MAQKPNHCQCCRTLVGEQRVTYRMKKGKLVKVTGPLVTDLQPINLLDYGERWVCMPCKEQIYTMNYRAASQHLTLNHAAE